jgi:type III secretory pathway component EscT
LSEAAFLGALLRAAPLCLVLPMPALAARLTLALTLAVVALGAPGVDHLGTATLGVELARGIALGLGVAAPLYAARWAGALIDRHGTRQVGGPATQIASALGWVVFCAAGGAELLAQAYLHSYARWPAGAGTFARDVAALTRLGVDTFALSAQLALPALLVLGLVELSVGLVARFERTVRFDGGIAALSSTARPMLVALLLTASVAAFTHGVGAAVLGAVERERSVGRP